MRINKITQFKDPDINRQFDEIIEKQFLNFKEVEVNFTSTGVDIPVETDVADRYLIVYNEGGVVVKLSKIEGSKMFFQSVSGTGKVKMLVWKS